MPTWTLPEPTTASPPAQTAAEKLLGRDVLFKDDYEVGPSGDYLLVEGVAAARQSIINEARTTPGELVAVPEYGMGLKQFVYRPSSRSNRDEAANRVRERLAANPRVERTDDVSVERNTDLGATVVTARVIAAGREVVTAVNVEDRT